MNHEVLSARATITEFTAKHGFKADFVEGQSEPDALRLRQSIRDKEARTGEPSPQRLLAERAIEVIRASSSPEDMRDRADKAACTIVIEDKIGADGKLRYSGFVKEGDGSGLKVSLYALPKDCAAYAIMKRFDEKPEAKPIQMTANQAKFHARAAFKATEAAAPASFDAFLAEVGKRLDEKGLTIERYGKTGAYIRFADGDEGRIKLSDLGGRYSLSAFSKKYNGNITPYASNMHGNQEKVNGFSAKSPANNSLSPETLASSAVSRAASADARAVAVAAESTQAKTLVEALDDADAQAVALDAARRAHAAAARAEARAERAEQQLKELKEKTAMMDLKPTKPTMTTEKATAEQSTTIEAEAAKTKNPTLNTPQKEAASKASDQEKVNKEKEFDISLDLCGDPAVPGIAADAAQDNAQTGPRGPRG